MKDCEINVSSYSKSEGKQYSEISEVCACVCMCGSNNIVSIESVESVAPWVEVGLFWGLGSF